MDMPWARSCCPDAERHVSIFEGRPVLRIQDNGEPHASLVVVTFCPWCGSRLPVDPMIAQRRPE